MPRTKGHVPMFYWDNRKGLIKEVISQQRSQALRGSMWVSGDGTIPKRPWVERVIGGFRNSKEASVAGTE